MKIEAIYFPNLSNVLSWNLNKTERIARRIPKIAAGSLNESSEIPKIAKDSAKIKK